MTNRLRIICVAALVHSACGGEDRPDTAHAAQDAATTNDTEGIAEDAGLDSALGTDATADAAGPASCQTTVDGKGDGDRCIDGLCKLPRVCQADKQCVADMQSVWHLVEAWARLRKCRQKLQGRARSDRTVTTWKVRAGFVTVPDSVGDIWRVMDQGFVVHQSCGGGYCVVGGIAP